MKKVHFIGICGKGMSAVAALLKDAGYTVTGTEKACHPPVRDFLETHDMWTYKDYARAHIPEDAEYIVAGASASVDRTTNEEVDEAYVQNIPVKTFPQILAELSEDKKNIVVAGSYGKTTTTALVTWFLHHAGTDPSYFIGEVMNQLPSHGHLGTSDTFVLEGDEYPTDSKHDPRSKFLVFGAHDVLLTALDHDHVNVFPTHENFLQPFKKLLKQIPDSGLLVACTDNEHVRNMIITHTGMTSTYGLDQDHKPDWTAGNVLYGDTTTFDLIHKENHVISLETQLLGVHNIQNIVGAAAMVLEKKLITPEQLQNALKEFKSVPRRMERKTDRSIIPVYEGFGSSREKALSAIAAMRLHFPKRRLLVVFEPHTFSWRNREKLHWYDTVFTDVDHVLLYKPLELKTTSHDQVTHQEITDRVQKAGIDVTAITSGDEGLKLLETMLTPDDCILLLTSGPLDGMIQTVPELTERLFPKRK